MKVISLKRYKMQKSKVILYNRKNFTYHKGSINKKAYELLLS